MWQSRALASWPAWLVLTSIALAIGQYAFCVVVTPPADNDPVDLVAFHDRQYRRYAITYLGLIGLAIVQNVLFGWLGAYDAWLRDTTACLVLVPFALLPLCSRARWVQLTGAAGVAVNSTYLMIVSVGIVVT